MALFYLLFYGLAQGEGVYPDIRVNRNDADALGDPANRAPSSSVNPPVGHHEQPPQDIPSDESYRTFKPPAACQARIPMPGNVWRYCKLPWNHRGGHLFD